MAQRPQLPRLCDARYEPLRDRRSRAKGDRIISKIAEISNSKRIRLKLIKLALSCRLQNCRNFQQ
ncbi:MAG: hypothetical protein F6K37_22860 [Moorea sp. SIO4E2]|uniref:hypothetical protein n=1 Tax=Moorena sp. SIO4E2 TaxID=2607826 RepID=UPI0013B7062A|nr:hypothetical protein [Moorena sp. SIO4E2]NEQ08684.1 hypothetical protein [Moorena sp. SIO4E2]